ncbi:MAG: nuclear transport factor 2 family protein [Acidobacteriota bacterium]
MLINPPELVYAKRSPVVTRLHRKHLQPATLLSPFPERGELGLTFKADPEKMARSLHPDMVKRYVGALPSGRQVVHSLTRDQMIEMTRSGGGSRTLPEGHKVTTQVLVVSGDVAVVRASSSEYYEYLSLAKCNGQWVIVSILWRFQSSPPPPR